MEVVDVEAEKVNMNIARDELLIINAVLNEVCNGIDIVEFETRLGADKERVSEFLDEIDQLLDRMGE